MNVLNAPVPREQKACKYGQHCKKKDCWFFHPEGRLLDLVDDPNAPVIAAAVLASGGEAGTRQFVSAPPSDSLYIKGLPPSMSDDFVKEYFSQYGPVTSVRLLDTNGQTKDGRGQTVAIVRFAKVEHAAWLAENADGKAPEGFERPIYIKFAQNGGQQGRYKGPPAPKTGVEVLIEALPDAGALALETWVVIGEGAVRVRQELSTTSPELGHKFPGQVAKGITVDQLGGWLALATEPGFMMMHCDGMPLLAKLDAAWSTAHLQKVIAKDCPLANDNPEEKVTARYLLVDLAPDMQEADLRWYFGQFGQIEDVTLRRTESGRTMGSVKFWNPTNELRNKMLSGTHMVRGTPVMVQTWKTKKLATPGYRAKMQAQAQQQANAQAHLQAHASVVLEAQAVAMVEAVAGQMGGYGAADDGSAGALAQSLRFQPYGGGAM